MNLHSDADFAIANVLPMFYRIAMGEQLFGGSKMATGTPKMAARTPKMATGTPKMAAGTPKMAVAGWGNFAEG